MDMVGHFGAHHGNEVTFAAATRSGGKAHESQERCRDCCRDAATSRRQALLGCPGRHVELRHRRHPTQRDRMGARAPRGSRWILRTVGAEEALLSGNLTACAGSCSTGRALYISSTDCLNPIGTARPSSSSPVRSSATSRVLTFPQGSGFHADLPDLQRFLQRDLAHLAKRGARPRWRRRPPCRSAASPS